MFRFCRKSHSLHKQEPIRMRGNNIQITRSDKLFLPSTTILNVPCQEHDTPQYPQFEKITPVCSLLPWSLTFILIQQTDARHFGIRLSHRQIGNEPSLVLLIVPAAKCSESFVKSPQKQTSLNRISQKCSESFVNLSVRIHELRRCEKYIELKRMQH